MIYGILAESELTKSQKRECDMKARLTSSSSIKHRPFLYVNQHHISCRFTFNAGDMHATMHELVACLQFCVPLFPKNSKPRNKLKRMIGVAADMTSKGTIVLHGETLARQVSGLSQNYEDLLLDGKELAPRGRHQKSTKASKRKVVFL